MAEPEPEAKRTRTDSGPGDAVFAFSRQAPEDEIAAIDQLIESLGMEHISKWTRRQGKHQNSLVHVLAGAGRMTAVKHLVTKHGFDINVQRESDGCTPTHLAVWLKRPELVDVLVELGADCSIKNKYGETVAGVKQERETVDSTNKAFEFLATPTESESELLSQLDAAIAQVGVERAKAARFSRGNTLLHDAVASGRWFVVEHLVTKHAFDINAQRSHDNLSPAHLCVWLRQQQMLDEFRRLGADMTLKNKYDETVEDLIKKREGLNNLIWLDLELTSLNDPKIMEVAVIVTDKTLVEIARSSWVLHHPKEVTEKLEAWHQTHFCATSEGGNGLFEAVHASDLSATDAEGQILEFLQTHCPKGCLLAGSSVHCDRQVLHTVGCSGVDASHRHKQEMPSLYEFVSHQVLDVSTLLNIAARWMPNKYANCPRGSGNHRAMQDIESSINVLKWAKEHLLQQDE